MTDYYRERRYEAGRRITWRAPAITLTSRPLGPADLLTTLALLHAVGQKSQPARAAWHRTRLTATAALALQQDPGQLEALQLQAASGPHPSADRVRPALRGREQSWVAWMFLADAIPDEQGRSVERQEALARASALAPDEPRVLLGLATAAFEARRWDAAASLFQRGLAFAPDEPAFPRGYLTAMAHHPRCGAIAREALARVKGDAKDREWIAGTRVVQGCRAHERAGGSP